MLLSRHLILYLIFILSCCTIHAQTGTVTGRVTGNGKPLQGATILLQPGRLAALCDSAGNFILTDVAPGPYQLSISSVGYKLYTEKIVINTSLYPLAIELQPVAADLEEVVITGTMKEVSRLESPIPVEVISPKLFQKNPTPSLFEGICMVNGVQPQLNCNVCNTGDIHINGMEGPYTLILIDGMPIVSALSTVYGLNGIPNSLVERIEIVKGPGSSLYGSEAMGGIINVITKNPSKAPTFSADIFITSWKELSGDVSVKWKMRKANSLLGINFFNYRNRLDKNDDNFTDVTLQKRISIFNKWNVARPSSKAASLGLRYVYEDRWGGEMQWNKTWRGSGRVYGESIYTKRFELIGLYQLPGRERIFTQFSYNWHDQNSYYGSIPYMATQQVGFAQIYWDKNFGDDHTFLLGASLRNTIYDDNTPATANADGSINKVSKTFLPGIFMQDEWRLDDKHKLLAGYRYDYNKNHGSVHSPRIAYKFSPSPLQALRASFGTGFRVVNLFTEDHAALTGAREVVITEKLKPEQSYNANLNYVRKIVNSKTNINFDLTAFYSYFTNRITGDFDTDPNKIIYDNLDGHAVSRGLSLNTDFNFNFPLKLLLGVSYIDVYQKKKQNRNEREWQIQSPRWSGNLVGTYTLPRSFIIDLTAKWNGPMRLPVLPNDFRPAYSPWFVIANIQLTKKFNNDIEFYGGVKNIFDFVPKYPILRAFDPFDKYVLDPVNNPYGYTFDPSYNYASLQGTRGFLGARVTLR